MSVPDLTIRCTIDGATYALTMGEFTGEDDQAIWRETGFTLVDIFPGRKVTLFTVAALVWRHRVRNGENVTFSEVNRSMTFNALDVEDETEDDEASPPPEA